MKIKIFSTLIIVLFLLNNISAQEKSLINATGLMSGSFMYKNPTSYTRTNLMVGDIQNYTPEALYDESSKLWCSGQFAKFPHVFIIELTETYIIEKLVFDNRCERNYSGIATKDIMIEFTTSNPEKDFQKTGMFTLKENQINEFVFPATEARWIKISILSNYGNTEYTELAEFKALGTPKNKNINLVKIDGKWNTNWGWVNFEQSDSSVSGNYEYNNGVVTYGGINRNKLTYKWIEKKVNQEGWSLLFLNEEGTRLTGVWCHNNNWNKYGFWIMDRKNGSPFKALNESTPLEIQSETPVKKEVVAEFKKTLQKEGVLILYGINFKHNSAQITNDSYTVLNQIVEVLNENPDFNIKIEGHTDNIGLDDYNLKLSLDRADAVKFYFITKGIEKTRLSSTGQGETKPIADNETEAGKGANRRVEIHLVK